MDSISQLIILSLSGAFVACLLAMTLVRREGAMRGWSLAATAIATTLIGYLFWVSLVRPNT